jgi:ribosomal protein S18 acetylase RimI-like enzyme
VKRVKEIVDRDLGFVPSETTSPETRTVYLYIANKRVVGFASAEIIKHAFVLHNSFERSTEPQNAMAGVHQLWVHAKFRNQGIATRLVDTIREKLVFGLTVPKVFLAFSSPTEAGARFARNYCGGDNGIKDILVYDCT